MEIAWISGYRLGRIRVALTKKWPELPGTEREGFLSDSMGACGSHVYVQVPSLVPLSNMETLRLKVAIGGTAVVRSSAKSVRSAPMRECVW